MGHGPARRHANSIGLLIAAAFAAAACAGSSSSVAPAPSPTSAAEVGTASVSPAPAQPSYALATVYQLTGSAVPGPTTPKPTAANTESPRPGLPLPSMVPDKELEGMLPSEFQGRKLLLSSARGDVAAAPIGIEEVTALLLPLGKTTADLSSATALDYPSGLIFAAYRVSGAEAAIWGPGLWKIVQKRSPATTVTDMQLGGKTVTNVVNPAANTDLWAWPRGDVLFVVLGSSTAQAGDAIAVMP